MNENPNPDKNKEKRRHPRIESINTVGYVLFDKKGKKIEIGKGHTLNLSQSGILLKTKDPVQGAFVVLVTMDLKGEKVKVKGRVVHTHRDTDSAYFLTGIEFIGPEAEQHQAIVAFVKTYQYRKHMAKKSPLS
jgi:c-di-GMP-binding flagellar brake protein YcgR